MSDEVRLKEAEDALRDALRIEPSQRLLARVRADAAGAGRPQHAAVRVGAAAAALLVAAATALLMVRRSQLPLPVVGAPEAPRLTDALSAPPAPPPKVEPPSTAAPREPARRVAARASEASQPAVRGPSLEIIVAPGQVEALARLVAMVGAGEIEPPKALLDPREASANLAEPTSIEIAPLDVAPIVRFSSPALSPLGRGGS